MSIHGGAIADKGAVRPSWETFQDIPANIDVERALLGAVLMFNGLVDRIPDLRAEHFFSSFHGEIYAAVVDAVQSGRTATAATLAPRFKLWPVYELTNGAQYLGRLLAGATTTLNIRDYAKAIIEHSQRRALIVVAEELAAQAYDVAPPQEVSAMIEGAERALYTVATAGRSGREVSLADAARAALQAAQKAYKLGGKLDGIATGLTDLDKQLGGGLGNSDLVILGGRPSMGKTALATKIALNVARGTPGIDPDTGEVTDAEPRHVHFFSLEMSGEQLANRLLSDLSGISSNKIRRGELSDNDFRVIMDAERQLSQMPMTIEETGGISIGALSAKARREKRKNGTGLIVVDYLQLMQAGNPGRGNRVQEITEITVGLKALAKELNIPILALSQLNRGLEKQEDKRPQLSDLRESGSIEQDADVVLFVYREEYYWLRTNPRPDDEDVLWQCEYEKVAGLAECIIGKQRHGSIGIVKLAFDGALTRFSSLAKGGGHD